MSGGEVAVTAVGLICGAVATYVGLRLVPIEQHLESRKEARREEAAAASAAATAASAQLERRLQAIHDDAKEAREKFEHRLAQIEQSYVSRESLERTINAVGERMDRGLARVEAGMKDLSAEVKDLAKRIAHVEAA